MAASAPAAGIDTRPRGFHAYATAGEIDDTFFRTVSGMRNGVLAITSDGRLALINDDAYACSGSSHRLAISGSRRLGAESASGRRSRPDRRVRPPPPANGGDALKPQNRSSVTRSRSCATTKAPWSRRDVLKDLTRVEQLEERERCASARRCRRDGCRDCARGEESVAASSHGRPAAAQGSGRATRRRCSATSSTKPKMGTRSCRKCSTSSADPPAVERTAVADAVQSAIHLADTSTARQLDVQVALEAAPAADPG